MWSAKRLVSNLTLAVPLLATLSPARADCPDQSAFDVPGSVTPYGPWQGCTISLTLEGTPIHIGEIQCPASRVRIPAHSVCASTPDSDSYCRQLANLPVQLQRCACGPLLEVTPLLSASNCDCSPPVTISWVQAFGTAPCAP